MASCGASMFQKSLGFLVFLDY
ncbi:hypothetical protein F383_27104 [Gossypium arboreum]|uniref:Uncharacterized protein n=1 Tax=Gossypium arboreum TaxID=29729 RepID=A0A0B0PB08_GOSAR|nr:hypothetical protein F383_27104 [Gossypium arboreum]